MKHILLGLFLIAGLGASAQITNPVKWQYSSKKISDKVYEVRMTAMIDKGWHLYAQDAGEGPEPTTVSFEKNPLLKLPPKANPPIRKVLRLQSQPTLNPDRRFGCCGSHPERASSAICILRDYGLPGCEGMRSGSAPWDRSGRSLRKLCVTCVWRSRRRLKKP